MAYYLKRAGKNLWHGKFSIFPEDVAVHAISTRLGGVSRPPYDALDLALHVGDEAAAVRENRGLFARSLGLDARRIVTPEQVHALGLARLAVANIEHRYFDEGLPDCDLLRVHRDRALLGAYAQGRRRVDKRTVMRAVAEVFGEARNSSGARAAWPVAAWWAGG